MSTVLAAIGLVLGLLLTPQRVAAADCWSFEGLDTWVGVVQQVLIDGKSRPAGAVVAFTTAWTPNPGDTLQVEGGNVSRVDGSTESPVWGTVWANSVCTPVGPTEYQPNPGERTLSLVQGAEVAAQQVVTPEEVTTFAVPAEARTFTYWDGDASHWVFKIERPEQSDIFLKLGDSAAVAADGQVFWNQPQEVIATFVTVYGPEFAWHAWVDQHGGPQQAVTQAITQPTAACPRNATEVARILLEWKTGQPEDEIGRLTRELRQLSPGNGWKFIASSSERARPLMAHDMWVVDVNGVRYSQPGVWSPKTQAGTIWFTACR
ncbi:MAG: hypothetical protein HYU80_02640 [Candidatus Blackburnbacteria bacterium]|nr:hypothetical protein [Candidatus Blackburnbacteria bacterium]